MSDIHIVFEGSPGPFGATFVEVEQDGKSIRFGKWVHRGDGYWALVIPDHETELTRLREQVEAMEPIVKAVAHIGIDFGFGEYELEDKHIKAAREIVTAPEVDNDVT